MLYNKPTRISLAMIGLLSALALTACSSGKSNSSSSNNNSSSQGGNQGSQGGTQGSQGGNQGGTQDNLPASTLTTTYYNISDYMTNPDVDKRYTDIIKLNFENGKVVTQTGFRTIGVGKPDINTDYSNTPDSVILAENFILKNVGYLKPERLMDTPTYKMRLYPDKAQYMFIDSSNGNTIIHTLPGKHIDLSGQKVYDQNSNIETTLNDRNGSVSEVYPKDAGCWAVSDEALFQFLSQASKPYWPLDTGYPSSHTTFNDWQNEVKKDINQDKDSYIDSAFIDAKVGSNNEYNAQMVKVKKNDTKRGIKMTYYLGAVEYEGKIYTNAPLPLPYPNSKMEIDPSSKLYNKNMCMFYNEAAKDYIVAQLKTLP